MSLTDFEVNGAAVLVGISVYVAFQLLLRLLAPRSTKTSQLPAPEEPRGTAPRAKLAAVLVVLALAALPFWRWGDSGAEPPRPEIPQPEPPRPHEPKPEASRPAPEKEAPLSEPKVEAPRHETEAPELVKDAPVAAFGPELAPSPCKEQVNSEAPINLKLSRQVIDGSQALPTGGSSKAAPDDTFIRSAYYGRIMVGSPPVEMTVVFDTGSGHLVLPSAYCKSETCKAHTRYRRSASSSARDIDMDGSTWKKGPRDSIAVSFGTGEISGVFVEDVICMTDLTNVTEDVPECTRFQFVAATSLSEDPFMSFQFDGVLGLGLAGLSQTPGFNFMQVMGSSIERFGGRTPHTFGIFLAESENEDSEIALGGWASAHLREDLSWVPIHNPENGHWIVPIRRIRVNSEIYDFCEDGTCRAAVDTGTSLLSVPTIAFREVYERLRHAAPRSGHCRGHGPMLNIELEHFTVSLGPRDIFQSKNSKKVSTRPHLTADSAYAPRGDVRCLPMLMTLDLEPPIGPKLFVLGEPVLRKYYTVYDGQAKSVGIARARHVMALSRDELLEAVPDVEPSVKTRMPTMFDIFRWRKALA